MIKIGPIDIIEEAGSAIESYTFCPDTTYARLIHRMFMKGHLGKINYVKVKRVSVRTSEPKILDEILKQYQVLRKKGA